MSQALQKYEKPNLLARIIKAFQMRFAGLGGGQGGYGSSNNWYAGFYNNSRINFANEMGRPTQSSLIMAAANWIGRILPQAPLQVMERDAKGKEAPIPNHPALLLFRNPNPFFEMEVFWKTFALHWLTAGNVYFIKVRNSFGQVIQLWPVMPWINTTAWNLPAYIFPRWPVDGSEFISFYEYYVEGRVNRIEVEDVIHFRDGSDPLNQGRTGLACIDPILREICADNEVPMYQYLLLKSGGAPPIVLSLKDGQSTVGFKAADAKASYLAATTGDQRGRVWVSGNAVELTKVGFSPQEMDMKVLRHLSESRFASVTGIAKETLGFGAADENSTYANVQQADERSIKTFMRPLWDYVESAMTRQLGPDFGLKENQRFDFDLTEIAALQEDQDLLHKRAAQDLASGGITIDEYRERISLPPAPNGSGKVFLWTGQMVAMTPETIKAMIEKTINPPEVAPPALQIGQGEQPAMNGNGQLPPPGRTKAESLIATKEQADEWLTSFLPPDAQGIQFAELID